MSARPNKPTQRGNPPARASSKGEFSEDGPTNVYDAHKHKVPDPAAESSQKIVAISMKTPADPKLAPVKMPERDMPHVRLRAMSEMSRANMPLNLGNLAPPYDPNEARKRNMKEYVLWGCVAVMLASAIALGVWFLAT
jgi:hypothetical protein